MRAMVAVIGVLVILLGSVGLIAPARFRRAFKAMTSQSRFIAAIVLRLGFGVLLWFAADQLRFPDVMRILAVIAFAAAVGVLILGRRRLDGLVTWWLMRSDALLRLSAALAGLFGAFLVYVATWVSH